MGIYIDLDFYEIDATNVKTITGILGLDNNTMIFVTPERTAINTVINIPDPKIVARDMRDAANISYYDEEKGHIEMDELMCETLESLGYGEAVKAFKNACKRYS